MTRSYTTWLVNRKVLFKDNILIRMIILISLLLSKATIIWWYTLLLCNEVLFLEREYVFPLEVVMWVVLSAAVNVTFCQILMKTVKILKSLGTETLSEDFSYPNPEILNFLTDRTEPRTEPFSILRPPNCLFKSPHCSSKMQPNFLNFCYFWDKKDK